jgi:hypothetical protein
MLPSSTPSGTQGNATFSNECFSAIVGDDIKTVERIRDEPEESTAPW